MVPDIVRENPLRIALAGGGRMAGHHARAIAGCGELATLAAVAEPVTDACAAIRSAFPAAAIYPSLGELLQAEDIDVVHVCTPPESHAALAAEALEAGCHVYVEKPFAQTVGEAAALLGLAQRHGLRLCAGHQLVFAPPMDELNRLVPLLGGLVHVESYFSFRPVRRRPDGRAAIPADQQLLDILPHPVYLLLRFLGEGSAAGEPEVSSVRVGRQGTVHALVQRGGSCGTLTVTLRGRPVESYVRLVGESGTLHADFLRGTIQRWIGPGAAAIDKALNPYRAGRQLFVGTTLALMRRLLHRSAGYPGLGEAIRSFYGAIREGTPSPLDPAEILGTVRVCADIAAVLTREEPLRLAPTSASGIDAALRVVVTGGTGFLGREVADTLGRQGALVRVVSRTRPASWERVPGVEYVVADLAAPLDASIFGGADVLVHCAAETAGGWVEHQRNSVTATGNVLRAAAAAGVKRFVHISSLAVLAGSRRQPIRDDDPPAPDPRRRGPYAWGKSESERLAVDLGAELGLRIKVVRPGALVDFRQLEPPGRLGRRIGNLLVAVGASKEESGAVDVRFAGRTIAFMAAHFDEVPDRLNLVAPRPSTKGELVAALKRSNPDLGVVWLPRLALAPLSWMAVALQKALRPGRPAIRLARVFAPQRCDASRMIELEPRIIAWIRESASARTQDLAAAH